MDISEMHVYFRQYAQQMGIQNVRAILPEQIDILLNTSISDVLNQVIKDSIGLTNDRVITDNSKIGQINALRSLYVVKETNFGGQDPILIEDDDDDVYGTYYAELNTLTDSNLLYAVDFSIRYNLSNNKKSTWYPIRLIDDMFLADTLNDFILAPRFRSPIAVINNINNNINSTIVYNNRVTFYIDKLVTSGNTQSLPYNISPASLRFSYIKKPNVVRYASDVNGSNIDCDLPESMHIDIIKHAVDLYNISIKGSLYNTQQQQQSQQQENVRNNANPYGE